MPTFLYRCPATGQRVQGWIADDGSTQDDSLALVQCLACPRAHLVDPQNGRVIGADDSLLSRRALS